MIKLDMQSRIPIYEQLKSKIVEHVMMGMLGADDQLPSVRNFARDLGVNPNTVQKAYQDLERDGIIYSVAGRGSYISPQADVGARMMEKHMRDLTFSARQARACGIGEDQIIALVHEIFKEGNET